MKGIFHITDWQEQTEETFEDGSKRTVANVSQRYEGAISGASKLCYQMHYFTNGSACFCGFEYLTANLEEQVFHIVLKHDGKFEQGKASSEFVIVSCQPDKELQGRRGRFVSTQGGQAEYDIEV